MSGVACRPRSGQTVTKTRKRRRGGTLLLSVPERGRSLMPPGSSSVVTALLFYPSLPGQGVGGEMKVIGQTDGHPHQSFLLVIPAAVSLMGGLALVRANY